MRGNDWLVRDPKTGRPYRTRRAAVRNEPDAAKVVKVVGGYRAFRFMSDYEIWRRQR